VLPAHIAHALDGLPARVLLRTSRTASRFWSLFTAIGLDMIALIATKNIAPVGIKTPSVDPSNRQNLPCHPLLLAHGRRVLKNLALDDVAEGDSELIVLPLKLTWADASPVRTVLRELP